MEYFKYLYLTALISLPIATTALARDLGEGAINGSASRALQNNERRYEIWSGIGRLDLQSGESCSAVLLNTRNRQNRAVGPGYLLTSGHCVFFEYGSARIDLPIEAMVTFKYFYDAPERHRQYAVRIARWSSLSGTDLAILEVDATLAELIQDGINPLNLASHQTDESQDVLNVGAASGFSEQGLRLSACTEQSGGTFIDQPGTFPLAMKNRCDLYPGISGSPMLNRRSNKITGIVSKVETARNALVLPGCDNSMPCKDARSNYSYSANFLHQCFVDGLFNPSAPDCALERVELTVSEPWKARSHVYTHQDAAGRTVLPTWDFRFSLEKPFYRFKSALDAKQCRATAHYGAAISTENAYINTQIGPGTGAYALCIIGVESAGQKLTNAILNNVFIHGVYLSHSLGISNTN